VKVFLTQPLGLMKKARPLPTDCSKAQISLTALRAGKLWGVFGLGAVSFNAGALLLREADRAGQQQRKALRGP
jgi:hypothetical protein